VQFFQNRLNRRVRHHLLAFSYWTLTATLLALISLVGYTNAGGEQAWKPILWQFSGVYAVAVLTPFIYAYTVRLGFSLSHLPKLITIHVLAMPVFTAAHIGLFTLIRKLVYPLFGETYTYVETYTLYGPYPDNTMFFNIWLDELPRDMVVYTLLVAFSYGIWFFFRQRELYKRAQDMELQLAQSRLINLKHQLQPHFLFNTLNMISSYIYEDVAVADKLITRLSDLLRYALTTGEEQKSRFSQERKMIKNYLSIIQMRFPRRLKLSIDTSGVIDDPLVPPMLLQPIVENAIVHGIAKRSGNELITIEAKRINDKLHIIVTDDAPHAPPPKEPKRKGIGLSNTREQLRWLYGENFQLELERLKPVGSRVTIVFPYELEDTGAKADDSLESTDR